MRRFVLALVALAAVSACSTAPGPPAIVVPYTTTPPAALAVVDYTTPPRVTGSWPPTCRARGVLPDPACTPGSVGPRTRAEVCATGFEKTERPSGTDAAKTKAMAAYGVSTADRARTELDHLVPLSLGGSNDATNLWPEVSDIPSGGFRNTKDDVERKILAAVCTNGLPLDRAQAAMAHDWTTALSTLTGG